MHAACPVAGAGSGDRGGNRGEVRRASGRGRWRSRSATGWVSGLQDEEFAAAFGVRGRPGWSPSRLALVTVLQRAEDLTDRQAAEAVRTRIDWQYLLGLRLDDPGFDHTVLAEFRARVAERAGQWRWTRCWRSWPPMAWSRRAASSAPIPRT